MPAAEITFRDGGRTLCIGAELELLIESPQAEGFLARQRPSHDYSAADPEQVDRPVPPHETQDDPAQAWHSPPDDSDIDEPDPDEDDIGFSP